MTRTDRTLRASWLAQLAARLRSRRSRGGTATEAAHAAQLAVRVAALLRGGIHPVRALALLSASDVAGEHRAAPSDAQLDIKIRDISRRVEGGDPIAEALAAVPAPPWRILAVAWRLAETSGAPLAPALDRIGAALHGLERLTERREVLLSGPQATVRLVSILPLGTFALGALLGFDPLPIVLTGPGFALFAGGIALLVAGVAWARALRRRVERSDRVDGIEYELLWIATGGGSAPALANLRVVDAVDALGASWVSLDRFRDRAPLAGTVAAATATGAALRPLLLEEAAGARARSHAAQEQAAERLAVKVLVPLGVCVLPAFVALGVAPVVLAMLGGV